MKSKWINKELVWSIIANGWIVSIILIHWVGTSVLYFYFTSETMDFEYYCKNATDYTNFLKAMVTAPTLLEGLCNSVIVSSVLLVFWFVIQTMNRIKHIFSKDVLMIKARKPYELLFHFLTMIELIHQELPVQGVISYIRNPYKPMYGYISTIQLVLLITCIYALTQCVPVLWTLASHKEALSAVNKPVLGINIYIYINAMVAPVIMFGFLCWGRQFDIELVSTLLNTILYFLRLSIYGFLKQWMKGLNESRYATNRTRMDMLAIGVTYLLTTPLNLCVNFANLLVHTYWIGV